MLDLKNKVPDLGTKVPDPKLEVPDLRSGGIRLNLTPGVVLIQTFQLQHLNISYRIVYSRYTAVAEIQYKSVKSINASYQSDPS